MSRTAEQIIKELKREGLGTVETVLIVAFEKGSDVIHHDDPRALKKLQTMMRKGGFPVGINTVKIEDEEGMEKGLAMSRVKPLEEYASNVKVKSFLREWHAATKTAIDFESDEIDDETKA